MEASIDPTQGEPGTSMRIEPIELDDYIARAEADPMSPHVSGIAWRLAIEVRKLRGEVDALKELVDDERKTVRA